MKLEEQRKALADNPARTEQLSARFAQFNQALAGFRESLSSLGDRIAQEEQASKALSTKVEADTDIHCSHQ